MHWTYKLPIGRSSPVLDVMAHENRRSINN